MGKRWLISATPKTIIFGQNSRCPRPGRASLLPVAKVLPPTPNPAGRGTQDALGPGRGRAPVSRALVSRSRTSPRGGPRNPPQPGRSAAGCPPRARASPGARRAGSPRSPPRGPPPPGFSLTPLPRPLRAGFSLCLALPSPRPPSPGPAPTHCGVAAAARPGDAGCRRAGARGRASLRPAAATAAAERTTEPAPGVAAPAARRGRRLPNRAAAPRVRAPPNGGSSGRPEGQEAEGAQLGAAWAEWSGWLRRSPEGPPRSRSLRPRNTEPASRNPPLRPAPDRSLESAQAVAVFLASSHSGAHSCFSLSRIRIGPRPCTAATETEGGPNERRKETRPRKIAK